MKTELTNDQQDRFDRLLQQIIDELPERIRGLIERVPVVVADMPLPAMVRQLVQDGLLQAEEDGSELCGLHTGVALIDRSIDDPEGWGGLDDGGEIEQVHLFRVGIASLAFASEAEGGHEGAEPIDWASPDADERLAEEIRITLLHEFGHHFGLDEDDLEELGYA